MATLFRTTTLKLLVPLLVFFFTSADANAARAQQQRSQAASSPQTPAGSRKVPTPAPPDLSGTWAQLQVHASLSEIPVVGNIKSKTVSLLLMKIRQNSDELSLEIQPCDVSIDSDVKQVVTRVPRAMVQALGTSKVRATLARGNQHWRFEQQRHVSILGARLKNPSADMLPTWARDYRVVDADKDGNPGVTVEIDGMIEGAIYLVQRSITQLRGLVEDNDKVNGLVAWSTEQSILGATSRLLESQPATRPDPDSTRSYFQMRRVESTTTCSDLRKNAAKLFPKTPE